MAIDASVAVGHGFINIFAQAPERGEWIFPGQAKTQERRTSQSRKTFLKATPVARSASRCRPEPSAPPIADPQEKIELVSLDAKTASLKTADRASGAWRQPRWRTPAAKTQLSESPKVTVALRYLDRPIASS